MILFKFLSSLLIFLNLIFFVGCVSDSSKKDNLQTAPQVVNRVTAINQTATDFQSRTQAIITLGYTSLDNEIASSCSLSQLNNVTVTQDCSCDGLGVCNVGITGVSVYTGPAGFSFNVVAGGKTSTTGKVTFNLTAPPAGSNIPPTISAIGAKTTTEGILVSSNFTIADSDSAIACANVTASSSNTTLVPNGNLSITGTGGNCTITVTPASSQIGSSNITLTLTDTGTPLPAKTAISSFTVTVNAFNDPPTISSIPLQMTNEDVPKNGIPFTIGDVDSVVNCSNVSAATSNSSLIAAGNIVIAGTAPNCTVSLSPGLNKSGSSTITLTLTDNGTPMPAKVATSAFLITVAAVNDSPVVSPIGNQVTNENVVKIVNFTITDVDSNLDCTTGVTVTSSNTSLVPNTNISLSGISPNCTATITPLSNQNGNTTLTVTVSDNGFPMPIQTASTAFVLSVLQSNQTPSISSVSNQVINEDTSVSNIPVTISDLDSTVYCSNISASSNNTALIPNANITISGSAPNCFVTVTPLANGYGSATITLTLTDNGTPLPALTASSLFNVTVNADNDSPSISTISNTSTNEGTATSSLNFTINDIDSSVSCAGNLTGSSSNPAIIPDASIVFSGIYPNCSVVATPAASGYGVVNITVTLTDNGTPLPALTAAKVFSVTVNQINHAPTISSIVAQTTNEDTVKSGVAFTIADSDSTIFCSDVTAVSSNSALVTNANVVITGTAPNCLVSMTPVPNAFGTTTITLTVTDRGTPVPTQSASTNFNLTVSAVNDAPTISSITTQSTDEDVATSPIAFAISDVDSSITCSGSVAGTSSNTTLVPNVNIVISGSFPNCLATITPAASLSGSSTITLTLTDNGTPTPVKTATSVFILNVNSTPDLSGTLSVANNLSGIASSFAANTFGRTMKFTGITSDEALSSFEICLGTAPGSCNVSSWVEATGYSTTGAAPTVNLGGSYKLTSGIGGAQVFTLTPTCGAATNYYYSVRGTNSSSRVSNILSTPAWTFWEPSCLGSTVLAQWLDANEPSTITIATGVSNWNDKSGNARAVTQATTTKQPVVTANGMGTGLTGITFNGTSSSLGRNSFIYAQGSTSIFTVIKAAASAGKYIISEGAGAGTNASYSPFITSATNTITGLLVNNANTNDMASPTTSTTIFDNTVRIGLVEDTGTSFYTYSNGTAQSQAITNYTRTATTTTLYRLGSRMKTNTESAWMSASIGEVIITNGVLSSLNRQKVEGYTAHKWGISTSLPVAHPYRTSPP